MAEDLVQDAFMKLLRSDRLKELKNDAVCLSYLFSICRNSLIDRRRREERLISNEQFDENMIVDDRSANVEEVIMEKQLFETIFDSLESSLDKEILRARMAGSSLKEISSQTGLSYSNVGVRLHRIKQKILAE